MGDRTDEFFAVPKTVCSTSQGEVELPICYFTGSHYLALFQVKAQKAQLKLAGVPLEPVLASGKAIAALSFYIYRHTDIGPYHEVGLALLVVPKGADASLPSITQLPEESRKGVLGFHLLDLPVSTPAADAAGREIWGYPKFVTKLPIAFSENQFEGSVLDANGQLILRLAGEPGYALPEELPGMELLTYSILDGQLLRTRILTRYLCKTSGGGSLKLEIGDSQHRMAENARDLGLAGRSPKVFQSTEDFQSLLFVGEPVPYHDSPSLTVPPSAT